MRKEDLKQLILNNTYQFKLNKVINIVNNHTASTYPEMEVPSSGKLASLVASTLRPVGQCRLTSSLLVRFLYNKRNAKKKNVSYDSK